MTPAPDPDPLRRSPADAAAHRAEAGPGRPGDQQEFRDVAPALRAEAGLELRPRVATGLGFIWLALGSVSLVLGIVGGNPALFAMGLPLAIVPLALLLRLRTVAQGLRLVRHSPASVHEGAEVVVELRLENRSRRTCHFPRVAEIFPPEIHAQKDVLLTDRLLPGETAVARYAGTAILPRGIYAIGPTAIRIADPFGWFEVRRRLPQRGDLVVVPTLIPLSPPERGGGAVSAVLAAAVVRDAGEENELRGVREYRRGDSLRRIHWPLTARHRAPVVKEVHPVSTGDLRIVIDLHRRAAAGFGRVSTTETAIRIAGSVAHEALRLGHRVELIPGRDPERIVPIAGGPDQDRAILDALVPLRSNESAPLDDWLPDVLERAPRGSTVLIFVSPYLHRDGAWLRAVTAASARGVRLVAVLFDAESYPRIWRDATAEIPAPAVSERLRAAGAIVAPVPCGSDLAPAFAGIDRDPTTPEGDSFRREGRGVA